MWCSILTDTASNCPSRLDTFFGARNAIAGSALQGEAEAINRNPDIGARRSAMRRWADLAMKAGELRFCARSTRSRVCRATSVFRPKKTLPVSGYAHALSITQDQIWYAAVIVGMSHWHSSCAFYTAKVMKRPSHHEVLPQLLAWARILPRATTGT